MNALDEVHELAVCVGQELKRKRLILAVAESCTGGWVGQAITAVEGSSSWFDRGFIVYSDRAKQQMLGVTTTAMRDHGSVSQEVVGEMAKGVLEFSDADLSIAISGIAGPQGGTLSKPVGTVWMAWALKDAEVCTRHARFTGDRYSIRRQSVVAALRELLAFLGETTVLIRGTEAGADPH